VEDGRKLVDLVSDDYQNTIAVDAILVGIGRSPNVEGLNLEAAGVDYDASAGIRVDDFLRTSNPHIYAAGDVSLKDKYTHAATASARIVVQNALFRGRERMSALVIPWCTFTDPEIAHVGMYPQEAEKRGLKVTTFMQELSAVDRAVLDGATDGFVKVHVEQGTDKILGATIVASHAGDLISEVAIAMAAKMGLGSIANVIHPYPTQAEAIKKVGDAYNRTRLTPFARRLFERWFSWTR
jgi:pyruvate/2-oxoglutarate dehydrogenase complex dihydrolipoamide dehydrogenase (E3) component